MTGENTCPSEAAFLSVVQGAGTFDVALDELCAGAYQHAQTVMPALVAGIHAFKMVRQDLCGRPDYLPRP